MSSLTKTTERRKKTKRLGSVRVIRPEQYDAFDVNSKLECIRALIPSGLCGSANFWRRKSASWLAGAMHGRPHSFPVGGMGAIPAVCSWPHNGIRFASRVSSTWQVRRFLCRTWTGFMVLAHWMSSCSRVRCMGFPVGTMK